MSTSAHKLPITAAEYLEGQYQSNPFPEDVKRPWYHLNRIED